MGTLHSPAFSPPLLAAAAPAGPVLVIGGSGTVGRALLRAMDSAGAVGTYLSNPNAALRPLDAADADAVRATFDAVRPGAVVLAAALADVDRCQRDPEASRHANVHAPRTVADACAQRGIPLVFLSTDYVFDGTAGPYAEDAPVTPINVYGRHKAQAEAYVLASSQLAAVARTSVVYGPGAPGIVEAVARALGRGETVNLSATHRNSPTHVDDLVAGIGALLAARTGGTFHLAGPETLSRLELGRAVARALGHDPARVCEAGNAPQTGWAPRPARCGLAIARAARRLGYSPRPVAAGLFIMG